jgi:hypothetical protein
LRRLAAFLGRSDLNWWFKPLVIAVVAITFLQPAVTFGLLALLPLRALDFAYPILIAVRLAFFYGDFVVFIAYVHFLRLVRCAALHRH